MLDTDTKRRIDTARDILVGKVPDPKSQVEQITIALIYKFMDDMDLESEELGGARTFFAGDFARYGWAKLMRSGLGGHETLNLYAEAIARMPENPGIPPLFRDIFKNAYLPYRDPETLRAFLKVIDDFEYDHSERLGDAFEYLLSVLGSQGDAGQFRTPRHIIDFIVAIVDPQKHETVMDPACGTAGFLISSYKHILAANTIYIDSQDGQDTNIINIDSQDRQDKSRNASSASPSISSSSSSSASSPSCSSCPSMSISTLTPDDRARLAANFRGYDISPDMVRLSLVNLYLHGFADPHIYEYDTLTSLERWNETADVILANPPFMSPTGGIRPHNRFSVQSKRSEVLFVDYIAEHLTPTGRAGIIVPEGIIFQSGTAYRKLREVLVNAYLIGVISLPSGVFMPYTGVKTSILVFDRVKAKQNSEILFSEVKDIGYSLGVKRTPTEHNDLPSVLEDYLAYYQGGDLSHCSWLVSRDEVRANDNNLVGSRYRPTLANGSRRLVQIADVCTITKGAFSSTKTPPGPYPLILTAAESKTSSEFQFEGPAICVPLISSLGHGKAALHRIHFVNEKFALADLLVALQPVEESELDVKFLYYALDMRRAEIAGLMRGAANVSMKPDDLAQFEIPLPPLDVQREIVAEIEGYQKVIDGARAVLDHYRPHIPIDPEWEMVELGEVCEIKSGGTPSRSEPAYWNGTIPWIGSTVCKDQEVTQAEEFITEVGLQNSSAKLLPKDTVLIALVGATIGKTGLLKFRSTTNQNVAGLIPKSREILEPVYLFHAAQRLYPDFLRLGEGKFRMANLSFIREQKIPLPPLETQRAIVAEIEAEQALVNANRELIARFERKIQATLARVWGEESDG